MGLGLVIGNVLGVVLRSCDLHQRDQPASDSQRNKLSYTPPSHIIHQLPPKPFSPVCPKMPAMCATTSPFGAQVACLDRKLGSQAVHSVPWSRGICQVQKLEFGPFRHCLRVGPVLFQVGRGGHTHDCPLQWLTVEVTLLTWRTRYARTMESKMVEPRPDRLGETGDKIDISERCFEDRQLLCLYCARSPRRLHSCYSTW